MFSSKGDSAPAANGAQPANIKRASQVGSPPTIVSSDVVVNGTLTSTGEIQVDGRVDGDVCCVSLVIGETGQVYGEIIARDVTNRGRVNGQIRAHKVLLSASSHFEGTILHAVLAVEAGAFIDGSCQHSDTPLPETSNAIVPTTAAEDYLVVQPMVNENSQISPSFQPPLTSKSLPQRTETV